MENTFIKAVSNKTYTENGALTNKSTQSALLDFYFHGAALRRDGGARTIELFENAFKEDKTKALKILKQMQYQVLLVVLYFHQSLEAVLN